MRITCPECEYSREIPDDKIPANSVRATCPKCGTRFRFRGEPEFELEPEEVSEAPRTGPEARPESPGEQAGETPPPDQDQAKAPSGPGAGGETGPGGEDIWQRLENIGSGGGRQDAGGPKGPSFAGQDFGQEDPEPAKAEVPWERLDTYGFFGGFFQTIKRAMLSPGLFFSSMPVGRGMLRPILFAVLLNLVNAGVTIIWKSTGIIPRDFDPGYFSTEISLVSELILIIIFGIPFIILMIFVVSLVYHILLTIFQSNKSGYEGTLRVISYSTAPQILAVIPFVGIFISWMWSLIVTIIGIKEIHKTSYLISIVVTLIVLILYIAIFGYFGYQLYLTMHSGSTPMM